MVGADVDELVKRGISIFDRFALGFQIERGFGDWIQANHGRVALKCNMTFTGILDDSLPWFLRKSESLRLGN